MVVDWRALGLLGTVTLVVLVVGVAGGAGGGSAATIASYDGGAGATPVNYHGEAGMTAATAQSGCTASPTLVDVGEEVTLDASDSSTDFAEFDVDNDGEYELTPESSTVGTWTYQEPGRYEPFARPDGDPDLRTSCGEVVVNEPPTAAVQVNPLQAVTGENITFDASGSTDIDGELVEYRWDFNSDGVINRATEGPLTQESFDVAGGRAMQVTVVDDNGSTDTAFSDFVVEENQPPTADLVVNPRPATVGENVTFDASGSADPDRFITEYRWDFDGDSLVERTTEASIVEEDYTTSGPKNPSVTVVDNSGATDSATRDLFVEQRSVASCTASPTTVGVNQRVTLDASDSEANFVEFDRTGDSGYTRTDEDDFVINVSYAEPGTYNPLARADGVEDSALPPSEQDSVDPCGEVVVEDNEPPSASFTIDPRPGAVGQPVTFDASASADPDGEIIRYRWTFDDGSSNETTEPVIDHTYDQQGSYAPSLTVVDNDGATDRAGQDLFVERQSTVVCEATPRRVEVDETVTLDASGSELVEFVEFDTTGNGEYTEFVEGELVVETSYDEPGTYEPQVRAGGDEEAVAPCGEVVVEANEPPEPDFSIDPTPGTVGQPVTFDASASADPDGRIVEYRWDFDDDGTIDETTSNPVTDTTYDMANSYVPTLTVEDNEGATATVSRDLFVEQPRTVTCEVESAEVEVNETVTLDASGSEGVEFVEFDTNGDGEYTDGDETDLLVETSYPEAGTYSPMVRAGVEGEPVPCGEIVVNDPEPDPGSDPEPDSGSDLPIPPWQLGLGGLGGLAGLGLLYYFLSPGGAGGGGGGGGGGGTPKPKPKPSMDSDVDPRYETGVFEIPPSSGRLVVPVDFEPDLVFFSATNGARTDAATDRTAGWSRGIGFSGGAGIRNYSLTVADDAQTTDQATCAADDDTALQLLRHASEQPPGRVRVSLAETTSEGFEVDVQVPGDDPFASGTRVHYQAIRTATEVDVDVGTFMTPTEPGTQLVDLGVDADHVSLVGSAAVTDTGRLWTTDRGVAMTGGHAVAEAGIDQAVWGASAWPRAGHGSAAVAGEGAINLLYQDGDDLAGRTRGTVTDLGQELRLRYDRVYNGPHKLGSTARHVVSYLAMNGGESMRPAVGAVPLPGPDEQLQVNCGFEPEMVEVTVSPAPLGEEVPNWAAPQPFGWSDGTAIADEDDLRQYVLHHAFTPAVQAGAPVAGTGATAGETTAGGASTDGGRPPADGSQPDVDPSVGSPDIEPGSVDAEAPESPGPQTPESPAEPTQSGTRPEDQAAQSPDEPGTGNEPYRIQPPTDVPDDGIVGLSLLQDEDGTVVGRDECRIAQLTDYGFDVSVDRVDTDGAAALRNRPTLIYRAWPTVDGREGEAPAPDERPAADQTGTVETGPAGSGDQTDTTGDIAAGQATQADRDTGEQPMQDPQQSATEPQRGGQNR